MAYIYIYVIAIGPDIFSIKPRNFMCGLDGEGGHALDLDKYKMYFVF